MDMRYHVSGRVVAIEAVRTDDRANPLGTTQDDMGRVSNDGIWAIVTIEDSAGRRWSCPWGIDPDVPNLGAEMVLGCVVTKERVT
jgi:hypothetical protein